MDRPPLGKPPGSTNGRRPAGGYPEVPSALGAFLAGFIEGEASFCIAKQPKRTNYRCSMTLCARDDDEELLRELANATRLGTITRHGARDGQRPQVTWGFGAKSDCLRMIEILNQWPLRGRKSLDFAIWSAAVEWWTLGDATRTVRFRDWTAMAYLKDQLETTRRFLPRERRCPEYSDPDGLEPDWIGYLSGLITAEATLGVHVNGAGLLPRLSVMLRRDDRPLLDELRRRTQVGRVYEETRVTQPRAPAASWHVRGRDELTAMVEILDLSRPKGRKGREYEIWREAVAVHAGRTPRRHRTAQLSKLRAALAAERAYRPHAG